MNGKIFSKFIFSPISIILLISIILALITAINGLFITNEGGASLGGVIALIFLLILILLFCIEQFLINYLKISLKITWITEMILVVILILIIWLGILDLGLG